MTYSSEFNQTTTPETRTAQELYDACAKLYGQIPKEKAALEQCWGFLDSQELTELAKLDIIRAADLVFATSEKLLPCSSDVILKFVRDSKATNIMLYTLTERTTNAAGFYKKGVQNLIENLEKHPTRASWQDAWRGFRSTQFENDAEKSKAIENLFQRPELKNLESQNPYSSLDVKISLLSVMPKDYLTAELVQSVRNAPEWEDLAYDGEGGAMTAYFMRHEFNKKYPFKPTHVYAPNSEPE